MNKTAATIFSALALSACTTIPDRFTTSAAIVDGCGYVIEGEDGNGFALEIAYKEYSFFPSPDPIMLAARACFIKTATEIARREGKTIIPPTSADMSTQLRYGGLEDVRVWL